MLKYNNILIAVDGSREAEWAFHKAIEIAKRNDSTLSVINVIDTRSFASVEAYDRTISQRANRSEEHTSELQSRGHLVCRLLLEKKNKTNGYYNKVINQH